MFDSIGQHPKSKRFYLRYGIVSARAVLHCAWQLNDFSYPAPVDFLFSFDCKIHQSSVPQSWFGG